MTFFPGNRAMPCRYDELYQADASRLMSSCWNIEQPKRRIYSVNRKRVTPREKVRLISFCTSQNLLRIKMAEKDCMIIAMTCPFRELKK